MLSYTPPDGATIIVEFAAGEHGDGRRFTFGTRTLPGARWEQLLREHPPTEAGLDYDPDTFPPALLAESITGWTVHGVAPDLNAPVELETEHRAPTLDETTELWQSWPQWARRQLLRPVEVQNVLGGALGKANGRPNVTAANAPSVTG